MKILIIHNILWTHYKSVLFEAIEQNKTADMEICVLQIAKNDISRKSMSSSEVEYEYNYHLLFDDYIENIPTYKKVREVLKFIKFYNPDIVNVSGWAGDLSMTLSIVFSFCLNKKIVISNESTLSDQKRSFFKESLKKLLVKMATGFIVFGRTSKNYLTHLGATSGQFIEEKAAVVDDIKLREIYEFSKNNTFLDGFIKTKYNFIFVGRVIDVKNIPMLIRAFQRIKSDTYDAKDWGLIILGNGSLDDQINNEISNRSEDIYKFDSVGWQGVPEYFSKSDCLILPSYSETWGLVVNEAMICGLSVIVSDACGCKDDLIDKNGFIFESGNNLQLEECMKKIIIDGNERELMKKKSMEIIEEFKVQAVAERIVRGFQCIYQKS